LDLPVSTDQRVRPVTSRLVGGGADGFAQVAGAVEVVEHALLEVAAAEAARPAGLRNSDADVDRITLVRAGRDAGGEPDEGSRLGVEQLLDVLDTALAEAIFQRDPFRPGRGGAA